MNYFVFFRPVEGANINFKRPLELAVENLYKGIMPSEIEYIDSRRTKKGRVEYLVKWVGYGEDGSTWYECRNPGEKD